MGPLLQKRSGVIVDPAVGNYRIVHCEQTRQYFRMGIREAEFFEHLDGLKTAGEIRVENPQQFTPEQVDALIAWLEEQQLLGSEHPVAAATIAPWYRRVWGFIVQPDLFRFQLYNPDGLLDRYRTAVDLLFSRAAVGCYLMILLAPALVYLVRPQLATDAAHHSQSMSLGQWVSLYASLFLMNILHEFAHAISCKHFGGKVNKIGLMFLYLNPVIYCDVSDSWRFRSVNQKLVVTIAGLFLQLLLTSAGLTLWLMTGSALVLNFVIFNTAIAMFNFFPFIRLDGYWMLVHLIDEPNLRTKGLKAVDSGLRKLLLRDRIAAAKPVSSLVLTWGIGHALAIPLFWLLGLYALYNRLARVSVMLALLVSTLFAGVLLYRVIKIAVAFRRSMALEKSAAIS